LAIMHYREESNDGKTALVVEFEVKEISGPEQAYRLKAELLDLLKQKQPDLLVLDCSSLNQMVTLGFGAFLSARKLLSPTGGRVALCGLNPLLRESVEHCGLDRILIVADDISAAWNIARGGAK
jgi:anti-anti-sigma factor